MKFSLPNESLLLRYSKKRNTDENGRILKDAFLLRELEENLSFDHIDYHQCNSIQEKINESAETILKKMNLTKTQKYFFAKIQIKNIVLHNNCYCIEEIKLTEQDSHVGVYIKKPCLEYKHIAADMLSEIAIKLEYKKADYKKSAI